MLNLFFEGGWLFMSLISIAALVMLFFSVKTGLQVFSDSGNGTSSTVARDGVHSGSLYYIRFFGMLALVIGLMGQAIGLYEAMQHIAIEGGMSQAVLAGGFRVSSITTLYGFFVFVIAHLIWFGLDFTMKSPVKQ